jgi:hypothetical protein
MEYVKKVQNVHNQYNTKVSRLSIAGLIRDFLLMFLWSLSVSWSVSFDTFSIWDRLYHDISVWILHMTGGVVCSFVWFTEYLFLIWKCMMIRNFQAITVLLSKYCFFATFSFLFFSYCFLNIYLSLSLSLSLSVPLSSPL